MVILSAETETQTQAKPRFRRWRFGLITTVLVLVGWGFSNAWYCYPAPSLSQQAVFFLVLTVILVQTIQAGWYIGDTPSEPRDPDATFALFTNGIIMLLPVACLIFGMLMESMKLTVILTLLSLLFSWFVYVVSRDGNSS